MLKKSSGVSALDANHPDQIELNPTSWIGIRRDSWKSLKIMHGISGTSHPGFYLLIAMGKIEEDHAIVNFC